LATIEGGAKQVYGVQGKKGQKKKKKKGKVQGHRKRKNYGNQTPRVPWVTRFPVIKKRMFIFILIGKGGRGGAKALKKEKS